MRAACTGEPVSWLRLELHALGELPEAERASIAAHLGGCDVCRACAAQIERAAALTPLALPALPFVRRNPRVTRRLVWPLATVAAAAMVLLAVLPRPQPPRPDDDAPPSHVRVKGGELAVSLVRERDGQTTANPTTFARGDRFKLLVTCPPADRTLVEVVVFQEGASTFPYGSGEEIECGNLVPLAGAFTLDGRGEATVCAALGARPLDERALAAGPSALRGAPAACVQLHRVSPGD